MLSKISFRKNITVNLVGRVAKYKSQYKEDDQCQKGTFRNHWRGIPNRYLLIFKSMLLYIYITFNLILMNAPNTPHSKAEQLSAVEIGHIFDDKTRDLRRNNPPEVVLATMKTLLTLLDTNITED